MLLLAVALIMVNGLLMAFGPDARSVQVDYALDSYEIGPLLVDKVRVICAGVALVVLRGAVRDLPLHRASARRSAPAPTTCSARRWSG